MARSETDALRAREPSHVSWDAASGFRRDAIHYPARPVTPLDASYLIETVQEGSRTGFAEWSLPTECVQNRIVNGWVFTRVVPAGGGGPAFLSRFPWLAHLWRVIPPLRRRIKGFERFLSEGGFEAHLDTWETTWRPEALRRLEALRSFDLDAASPADLADHLEAWHDYMVWQWSPHVRIHLICFSARGRFAMICRNFLGLSPLQAWELVKGTHPVLLEPSRALASMAQRALDDSSVAAIMEAGPEAALPQLRETWFGSELDGFLDAHGDVPVDGFELSRPTWREHPERVVGIVRRMMQRSYDPEAKQAEAARVRAAAIEAARGSLEGPARQTFERWLQIAERAYPLNDTHNHLLFELPSGLIRYAALAAGKILVRDGRLADPHDVFFLSLSQLTSALRTGESAIHLAASARQAFDVAAALQPPDAVGEEALPPLNVFPAAVAESVAILLDQNAQMSGAESAMEHAASVGGRETGSVEMPPSGLIRATAGAPGVAEGPARLVRDISELDRVQPGDILVCPITGPAWTAVFPILAGLVTEAGGPLSHPAIVAREFGIPSVVGAGEQARRLSDGSRIRVDGDTGVVSLVG